MNTVHHYTLSPLEKEIPSNSSMTTQTNSENSSLAQSLSKSRFEKLSDRSDQMLNSQLIQTELTMKMNSKAINWFITTCWMNNIDQQTLYHAICLFYCYKSNRNIQKTKLELLLVTILYISSKKASLKKMKIKGLQQICHTFYSTDDILAMEAEILEGVDYNLEFDLSVYQISWQIDIFDERTEKLQFFLELSALHSCELFINRQSFDKMVNFVCDNITWESSCLKNTLKFAKTKQAETIFKKYASKLQVNNFIQQLRNRIQ